MNESRRRIDPAAPGADRKMRFLSAADVFAGLNEDELNQISRATSMRSCPAGTVFYTPEQRGEVLFILKQGSVRIFRMGSDGKKLVTGVIRPITLFGEMSILGQGMYNSYAEAAEDSLICAMSRTDVDRLILAHPQVVLRILKTVGQRMVQLEQALDDLAFRSLGCRLAGLLLREEAEGGCVAGMSHQTIAERLGVYRESVSVAMRELKAAGLVEVARKKIVIRNRQGLARVAAT